MIEEEVYLGGFTSTSLAKGLIEGYGIYITNKRIIGIKQKWRAAVGLLIGPLEGLLTKDESKKALEELERKKDFEVYKEQVREIELKKPTLVKEGHLHIILTSGEKTKIRVVVKEAFERLKEMMNTFKPDALKVIE